MDCSHCSAYLNHLYGQAGKVNIGCAGCRPRNKKCGHIIKRCEKLHKREVDFCYECEMFPCEHLDRLEARYIKHGYANSFIGNNIRIKEIGEEAFQAEQNIRFTCQDCGGPVSIHEGRCYKCGKTPI
jgi:hypothetical protein